jgi:hypothetical protein
MAILMNIYEYLRTMLEPMPAWLENFSSGSTFNRDDFLTSRVVFYPGSGSDGHPCKLFGSTHSAHCFVFADYGVSEERINNELEDPVYRFKGYHTLASIPLSVDHLSPNGWFSHLEPSDIENSFHYKKVTPFALFFVLERDHNLSEDHGARRLAILFLGADGIASYDALFCQQERFSPFVVFLQDHGFGGQYSPFGSGGLLERIAFAQRAIPIWLIAAENTNPWRCYTRIPDVDGDPGGMHWMMRYIFERTSETNYER